jgi:hypothetical protein
MGDRERAAILSRAVRDSSSDEVQSEHKPNKVRFSPAYMKGTGLGVVAPW